MAEMRCWAASSWEAGICLALRPRKKRLPEDWRSSSVTAAASKSDLVRSLSSDGLMRLGERSSELAVTVPLGWSVPV